MTIHSVDKRTAILRAATDVFAKRGFFNAQVADVARAAGVAAGTVYLYFRSKDDVLVSIFERTMREAIAEDHACVAPLRDPVEQLRALAHVHLELRQSTKFMERFSATLLREYLGIIRGIIVAGQQTGAFRADVNPTLAAKLVFGGLDEMATNWVLSRRKYSLAAEADPIIDFFVNGLAVPLRARSSAASEARVPRRARS